MVGVAESHGGFVHLYARESLGVERVAFKKDGPCVVGRLDVGGESVHVVAVHLKDGPDSAARRKAQLKDVVSSLPRGKNNLVVIGDTNVRGGEDEELCEALGLTDAVYPGLSWNPRVNSFFKDQKEFRGIGQRFDRVFFSGAVSVYACLVGQ